MTYSQVLEKLKHYCAYQERSHKEVEDKLWQYNLSENERENIIAELIDQNYLNEERFAIAFAEGKFRIKKWGKQKIKNKLKEKKVSDYCLKKALNSIDDEEYIETLGHLIENKYHTVKAKNEQDKKIKTARFCIQRGFESHLVWEMINKED